VNAVIYARYSPGRRQTEQSIEGQLKDCHAYAAREGYTVIHEYIDRALTGRSDERPSFQRMISDAPKRQFQAVLVWKLDRFARKRYHSVLYKHALEECGVRVLSVMEGIGTSAESRFVEAMLEVRDENYSVDLALKVTRGRRDSAAKGLFLGGAIPYGFKSVPYDPEPTRRLLVADEEQAPIVRYAFEKYAAGLPGREVYAKVCARGLDIGYSAFMRMLGSKKYIGVLTQGESVTSCPALVSEELFAKVQARLSAGVDN
jgi:DNA invertase Pin-like site-specific DNA recombinase